MVDTVKRAFFRHWMLIGSMAMIAVIIGVCGILVLGRTQPTFWIIYGGNTDGGDGAGGGMARGQFVDGGWTDDQHIFQVPWQADIGAGNTKGQTDNAMPAGHDAYNRFCGQNHCVIAGFSDGNEPALQLAAEVGLPASDTYLFGAPQPSTGIFHAWYVQAGGPMPGDTQFWLQGVMGLGVNRPTKPGMQVYFDSRDPYANAAPQCAGPGVFALSVGAGHYIVPANAAFHVWTEPDGTIAHEANYQAPPGLPASGSDASAPWADCPLGGWQDSNGAAPGVPGAGGGMPTGLPGAPGGGQIPSLPGAPTLPGLPGQPGG